MYKSLLDKVSRGRNLPPKRAAFFMAGTIPEKWRIYGIFRFCYHDFADSRCCAGRWPGRVGRCQPAGGLRLGQSWFQSQGMKQLMAGGGIILLGTTLIPLLSGLF